MSKEFRIGIITVLSGVILYYGFNFLKGSDILTRSSYYYTIFPNIGTLQLSNPVSINGVPVGKVTAVKLLPKQGNAVLVQFDVQDEVTLYESTIAELTSDLLGSTSIVLRTVTSGQALTVGDTLQSQIDKGLEEILETAQPVAQNLNITINRLNALLEEFEGIGDQVKGAVGTMDTTLLAVKELLEANKNEISGIMSNTNELIKGLDARVEELKPILSKTGEVMEGIDPEKVGKILDDVNTLTSTLAETMEKLNKGEGSLGKLMSSDSLYQDIHKTIKDLDSLIIHFDNYPKDFLKPLGRKHEKLRGK
ncbi:MAG: MlaD family protein [Cytophagales bacterium]|nr:MlaD family protein [Cytophagales bacterium]